MSTWNPVPAAVAGGGVLGQVVQLQVEAVDPEDGVAEAVDAVVVVVLSGEQVVGLLVEMVPEGGHHRLELVGVLGVSWSSVRNSAR